MRVVINAAYQDWEVEGTYNPGQIGTLDQESIPASFEVEIVFLNGVAVSDRNQKAACEYIQERHESDCIDAYLNSCEMEKAECEYEHAEALVERLF